MEDAVQTVMLQCELWTDNYADCDMQDRSVQYAYELERELAAEKKAEYGR